MQLPMEGFKLSSDLKYLTDIAVLFVPQTSVPYANISFYNCIE